MNNRSRWSMRCLAVVTLSIVVIFAGDPRPPEALAFWGVCLDDPIVWLNTGAVVDMSSAVVAGSSSVSHVTFVLHVPPGVAPIRVVRTAGVGAAFESVVVLQDSPSGSWADLVASSADGSAHSVTFSVHSINAGSSWASATGLTDQDVIACVSACPTR